MRLALLLICSLVAQSALPATDPIVDCRARHTDSANDRIECLEAAVRRLQDAANEPVEEISAPASDAKTDDAPAATVAVMAANPATNIEPAGLGAEQVREKNQPEDEEATVVIVAARYNARNLGTFRTEDGQLWRETTASPERHKLDADKRYTARIVRGKIGGYRMHVDGVRWMKKVERIE